MRDIVGDDHWHLAQTVRMLVGVYQDKIDQIQMGLYQPGTDANLDAAIALMPAIDSFLKQGMTERTTMEKALAGMQAIFNAPKHQASPSRNPKAS